MKTTMKMLMMPATLRYTNTLTLVVLFLGVLSVYALQWRYSLSDGFHNLTGGVSTVGAERVLHGEIPYRDFWTMYAPGQFYLLAGLFSLFGAYLMVEVVTAAAICAGAACICYLLVQNLSGKKLAALICAAIFVAATYNTGYFKRLGSYPPAIFLILICLHFIVLYYQTAQLRYLIFAGLATGIACVFKHDIGGYTAIAITTGMVAHSLVPWNTSTKRFHPLRLQFVVYAICLMAVMLPIAGYFALLAGPNLWDALIVFPLTDFRYARPEGYPSLWPSGIYAQSPRKLLENLCTYVIFTVPFGLQLMGLVAIGLAVRNGQRLYVAVGVSLWIGFLLHYIAAHVQINTHIITMSVYAAILGVLFYATTVSKVSAIRPAVRALLVLGLVAGWLLALSAKPLYVAWTNLGSATAEVTLAKVAGFKVSAEEAQTLTELTNFVNRHLAPNQALYVGLHRHDVIVIGDVMSYFILDRPIATRYHELHPAITDTKRAHQEMISELQKKQVSLIVLRRIFPDETLETAKANFLKHLPSIGSTDLDEFIYKNYEPVRQFGPYFIWERQTNVKTSFDIGLHKPW
jgi:hypothetical protein